MLSSWAIWNLQWLLTVNANVRKLCYCWNALVAILCKKHKKELLGYWLAEPVVFSLLTVCCKNRLITKVWKCWEKVIGQKKLGNIENWSLFFLFLNFSFTRRFCKLREWSQSTYYTKNIGGNCSLFFASTTSAGVLTIVYKRNWFGNSGTLRNMLLFSSFLITWSNLIQGEGLKPWEKPVVV